MRTERRCPPASLLLALAVGVSWPITGCGGGGDGDIAQASPEVQKKTEDMLKNMHKNMEAKYKAKKAGAAAQNRR
jgi:hypothetical protein